MASMNPHSVSTDSMNPDEVSTDSMNPHEAGTDSLNPHGMNPHSTGGDGIDADRDADPERLDGRADDRPVAEAPLTGSTMDTNVATESTVDATEPLPAADEEAVTTRSEQAAAEKADLVGVASDGDGPPAPIVSSLPDPAVARDDRPMNDGPVDEGPTHERAIDEGLTDEQAVDQGLTDKRATDEDLTGERVVDEHPAQERLADEQLADARPADRGPTDERFVDAPVAEGRPMAEQPPDEGRAMDAGPTAAAGVTAGDSVDGRSGGQQPAVDEMGVEPAALSPGDVEVRPLAALWPDDGVRTLRERWQDTQLTFVDTPRGAAAAADDLVGEAVDSLTAALTAQRSELGAWRTEGDNDTERLRVAMTRYREFLDHLLGV